MLIWSRSSLICFLSCISRKILTQDLNINFRENDVLAVPDWACIRAYNYGEFGRLTSRQNGFDTFARLNSHLTIFETSNYRSPARQAANLQFLLKTVENFLKRLNSSQKKQRHKNIFLINFSFSVPDCNFLTSYQLFLSDWSIRLFGKNLPPIEFRVFSSFNGGF